MLKAFMTKSLLVPVLAGALALGTTAAPARADNDAAKVIAGLAALALIAGAIERNTNDKPAVTSNNRPVTHSNRPVYGTVTQAPTWSSTNAAKRRALPEQCIRTVNTNRGLRTVYAQRCLNKSYSFANFLPQECRVNIRTANNRLRPAYVTQCLRRDGWKVHQGRHYQRFASND